MAWTTLKAAVDAVITTNGENDISGALLNSTLDSIIDAVGKYATFVGVATTSTNPGTQDGNVFYIASTAGVYTHFGITITDNNLYILSNVGATWSAALISMPRLDSADPSSFEVIGAAIPQTIKFGIATSFSSDVSQTTPVYYSSPKLFIDSLVESITSIRIQAKSGVTAADFKVLFYRAGLNAPIVKVHEIIFLNQSVSAGYINLDLNDLEPWQYSLYGCYVAVKCTSAEDVLKYNPTGANSINFTTVYTRLITDTFDMDINLNVLRAVGSVHNSQSISFGLAREKESGGNGICQSGENLQDHITHNRIVNLLPITYLVDTALTIPNNTVIRGVRGQTIIKAANGTMTEIISMVSKLNITFENITFEGFEYNDYVIADLAGVKAKTGMGVQNGVDISGGGSYYITFNNCTWLFFTGAGLSVHDLDVKVCGIKVDNSFFNACYIGLFIGKRGEYGQYSNISMNTCQIGLWIDAGNIILTGINSVENQVGMVFSGLLGENDSHDTVAASLINHNTLYSVVCTTIRNGVTFTGCHIYDGDIYIDDSIGFNYVGGIMAAEITFDGGAATKTGVNAIFNTMFFSGQYGSGTIHENGTNMDLLLKNNYYAGGQDSSGLNN